MEYIRQHVLPQRGEGSLTPGLLRILDEARADGLAPRGRAEWDHAVHPAVRNLRAEIVRCNLRLAFAQARTAGGTRGSATLADSFQAGAVGLLSAATRFDRSRGSDFKSYATHLVRGSIWRSLSRPDRRARSRAAPSSEDYAAELDEARTVSLAELPSEVLGGLRADAEVDPHAELQEALVGFLHNARPRHAAVLMLRFGLFGHPESTLDAIGQRLGITRERVRQIEETVLERLAQHLKRSWASD